MLHALHNIIVRSVQKTVFIIFKIGWRLEVRGFENIPQKGRLIIAGNHKSYADPPLVGSTLPRIVHFLAKKELFAVPLFGSLIRFLYSHPIDRDVSIRALKTAQTLLKQGKAVVLFPEGRRVTGDDIGPAKGGVGLLAYKTDTPVLPVYIHNANHIKKFRRLSVSYGSIIHPGDYKNHQDLTSAVMKKIRQMRDHSAA